MRSQQPPLQKRKSRNERKKCDSSQHCFRKHKRICKVIDKRLRNLKPMFSTNLVQGFIKVLFDFISKLSIIKQLLGSDFERWRVFQECATEILHGTMSLRPRRSHSSISYIIHTMSYANIRYCIGQVTRCQENKIVQSRLKRGLH